MLAGFLLLLLLTGGSSSGVTEPPDDQQMNDQSSTAGSRPHGCSYVDLIKDLNLTDKVKFTMARPVKHHKTKTEVRIHLEVKAILDVIEKEQKLVSSVWLHMVWTNEFIEWDPSKFCDIDSVSLPSELLWKPDIFIEEMTGKDKISQIPDLFVFYNGFTRLSNGMVLVSTCKMTFYKFPLDTHICSLTLNSASHSVFQMELIGRVDKPPGESTQAESEWVIMNITVDTNEIDSHEMDTLETFHIYSRRSRLVYSIIMKRRSVLYIVNFILPILFFLCLDLASFLISENGGEKLSFKVTVLLAVTVMQLILNEILPSSSDRIPLIAVYCMGTFGFMMMSLLETILMMYLMERDSVSQDKEAEKDQSLNEDCTDKQGKLQDCFRDINKWVHSSCVYDVSLETTSELLSVAKEGSSSRLTEECQLEKLSEELREVKLLLSSRKEEGKPGYWTRKTKTINRIYLIVYVITAGGFLCFLFSRWFGDDNY